MPLTWCLFSWLLPLFQWQHWSSLVLLYSHIPFLGTHSLSPHSCCCLIVPLVSYLHSVLLLFTFSPPSSLSSHMFCGKHHPLLYLPLLYSSSFFLCSLGPFSLSPLLTLYPFFSHPLLLIISPAAKWSIKPMRQSLPSSSHPTKVPQRVTPAPGPL